MSILARARSKEPNLGYATDVVSTVMKMNLRQISDQKVKIIDIIQVGYKLGDNIILFPKVVVSQ